jgi:hypothetical protein
VEEIQDSKVILEVTEHQDDEEEEEFERLRRESVRRQDQILGAISDFSAVDFPFMDSETITVNYKALSFFL